MHCLLVGHGMHYKTKAAKWNCLKAASSGSAPDLQCDKDRALSAVNNQDSLSAETLSLVLNPTSVNNSVSDTADCDVADIVEKNGTLAAGVIKGDV